MHVNDDSTPAVLGFDFPIGVPRAYAERAGITSFPDFLLGECGTGEWAKFFDVAADAAEISLQRPFYPLRNKAKGEIRRSDLTDALELQYADLLRRCERAQPGLRAAACSLFWTLGGNQVGKGALSGWRLIQREDRTATKVWPFDGALHDLAGHAHTTLVETYPTELYGHLGLASVANKRSPNARRGHASVLLRFAHDLGIRLDSELEESIRDGFGPSPDGEDPFDAVVGFVGMVNVLEGRRTPGEPLDDPQVQSVEGWILGQSEGASSVQQSLPPAAPVQGALRIGSIVLNVRDVRRAAAFWGEALGYKPSRAVDHDWAILVPVSGAGQQLALNRAEDRPPAVPHAHLDLYPGDGSDQSSEIERLLALGARRVDWPLYPDRSRDFEVLEDPDGNRFCVIDPDFAG